MTDRIAPCLCFEGQAEEAARCYVSLLPGSAIDAVSRYPVDGFFPAGTALLVEFTLAGRRFQALNGPAFARTGALSLSVEVGDQAELDRVWAALTADGGAEGRCGWCVDRFGFHWQVVPARLLAMHREGGPGIVPMMAALAGMGKLDLAALEAAYRDVPRAA